MPDTAINQGNALRFENAGVFRVISAAPVSYAVAKIVPGSLSFEPGLTEGVSFLDRGVQSSTVLAGDERPSKISVSVRPTKLGVTNASELYALLTPANSGGLKVMFTIEVEIPDSAGASTGTRWSWANCWLASPPKYQAAGSGNNTDTMALEIQSQTATPTRTAY